jgi:hypothetical protein
VANLIILFPKMAKTSLEITKFSCLFFIFLKKKFAKFRPASEGEVKSGRTTQGGQIGAIRSKYGLSRRALV